MNSSEGLSESSHPGNAYSRLLDSGASDWDIRFDGPDDEGTRVFEGGAVGGLHDAHELRGVIAGEVNGQVVQSSLLQVEDEPLT